MTRRGLELERMRNGGEIKKLNWTVDAAAGKMKLGDHLADNLDALSLEPTS